MASCKDDDRLAAPQGGAVTRALTTTVSGNITTNTTWSDSIYLETKVAVTNNATLTILPGTIIVGKSVPETEEDNLDATALVITKGAKIIAEGTASAPIVMTAENSDWGWGGLVILGKAKINRGSASIEGIAPGSMGANVDLTYGGDNDGDNSGILRYVRIEYAGAEIGNANELNAFTFGGVGSGTTVDHCQAYYGEDDAFEFFGGTVNAKYLVSTATDDDAFDFDYGYTGKIQFAVATIDATRNYSKDPNGIECDNDGSGSDSIPYTRPVLSNLTLVGTINGQVTGTANGGTALKSAANFRRNCQFELHNSILYGFPKGIYKETTNSFICKNNIVASSTADNEFVGFTPDATNLETIVDEILLVDVWGGYKNGNLVPIEDSPAATGASFNDLSGFDVVSYKGAFCPDSISTWLDKAWVR
jgi:hypothetical protein